MKNIMFVFVLMLMFLINPVYANGPGLSPTTGLSAGTDLSRVKGVLAVANGGTGSSTGGTSTLGTSASITSPRKSGDATTGLFSDGTGLVEISSSGTKQITIGTNLITVVPNIFTNGAIEMQNSGGGNVFWINILSGGNIMALGGKGGSAPASGIINIDNNSQVGIGTSLMNSKLEINGNATVGYVLTAAPANGLIVAGSVGIGTNSPTTGATLDVRGPIKLMGYTVSTLPSGANASVGMMAYVTDAVACTFLATLTGGSSTFCPVLYNGSAWVGG